MLAWMKTHAGGRLGASEVGRTRIWSDLHLDHAEAAWCFHRPFRTSQAMCRELVEAWRETVAESDLIICLGDVTVGAASRGIDEALASFPATRVLVAGNHEFPIDGAGVKDYGLEAVHPTLVCETDPPLLFTHEPLDVVPVGTVHVHGHLHGATAREIPAGPRVGAGHDGARAAGRRRRPTDDDRGHYRQRTGVARQEARTGASNGLRAAYQIGTVR